MLTSPSVYSKFQGRNGEVSNWLVIFTDGTTPQYHGNINTGNAWTSQKFSNRISSITDIENEIDVYQHSPSRATIDIELDNTPHPSTFTRPSDSMGSITTKECKIYHMNSPNATSLSDCLLMFSGSVQHVDYDLNQVRVRVEDTGGVLDTKILTTRFKDYPWFKPEKPIVDTTNTVIFRGNFGFDTGNENEFIPLPYGKYDEKNGLAQAINLGNQVRVAGQTFQGTKSKEYRYVFSDRAVILSQDVGLYISVGSDVSPIRAYYIKPKFANNFYNISGTGTNTTIAGQFWGINLLTDDVNTTAGVFRVFKDYTVNNYPPPPFNHADYLGKNRHKCVDNIGNTSGSFKCVANDPGGDTGSETDAESWSWGYLAFGIDDANDLVTHFEESSSDPTLYAYFINWRLAGNVKAIIPSNTNNSFIVHNRTFNIMNAYDTTQVRNGLSFTAGTLFGDPDKYEVPASQIADPTTYYKYYASRGVTKDQLDITTDNEYALVLQSVVQTQTDHKTLNIGDNLAVLGDIKLRLDYNLGRREGVVSDGINNPLGWISLPDGGVAVNPKNGVYYYTWFTDLRASLASTGVSLFKPIVDPAMIIADLLVHHGDIIQSQIDAQSFVDAFSYCITSRYNIIDSETTIRDVVEDLCTQALFTYTWTPAGKMKLCSTRTTGTYATVRKTFKFHEIVPDSLEIEQTPVEEIVNHITVKSRWKEEINDFEDIDVFENTTSQTAYGVKKRDLEFKNINSGQQLVLSQSPLHFLMMHLISYNKVNNKSYTHSATGNQGLWSLRHPIVKFSTPGSIAKHLECGDFIAFDNTSFSARVDLFGSTWSSVNFMITSISHTTSGTAIECLNTSTTTDRYLMTYINGASGINKPPE